MQRSAADVAAAYRHCETVTRQQAKNFAYGIALLPGAKRRALSAVYAFARRIDDIGDGNLPVPDKIAATERRARVGRRAGRRQRGRCGRDRRPGAAGAAATRPTGSRSR